MSADAVSDSEHSILHHSLPYFDSYILPSLPWMGSVDVLDIAEHSAVTYSQNFDQLRISILTYYSIKAEKALITRCKHKWKQCDIMSG